MVIFVCIQYICIFIHIDYCTGLRPVLLQKWQSASSASAKFEFIKAFMLDPQNLGSISIESEFVDLARKANDDCWIQLPLCKLRARGALAETVTSVAATFESGKGKVGNVSGKGGTPSQSEASKGGGKKGGKGAPKKKKAIISFVYLEFEPFSPQCLSTQRRLFRPSLMDA